MIRIDGSRRGVTFMAMVGVTAAGAGWFALAMTTGLIFHLMPAGPALLGGILLRRGGERSIMTAVTVTGAGALVSLAVALALARLGRPLDDPLWTSLVVGIGVTIGYAISRWSSPRPCWVKGATTGMAPTRDLSPGGQAARGRTRIRPGRRAP